MRQALLAEHRRDAALAAARALVIRQHEAIPAKVVVAASAPAAQTQTPMMMMRGKRRRSVMGTALLMRVGGEEDEMALRFREALVEVGRGMNLHGAVRMHFGLFSLVEEELGVLWSLTNEGTPRCAVLLQLRLTHQHICDRDGHPLQYASSAFDLEMLVPRAFAVPRELLLFTTTTTTAASSPSSSDSSSSSKARKAEENKRLRARIRKAITDALLHITPPTSKA